VPDRELYLNGERICRVSAPDYEWAARFVWTATSNGHGNFYVARWEFVAGRRRKVYLHRLIVQPPPRLLVDHRNGDTLDNRRGNLRVATRAQNGANWCPASGYRGVTRRGARWRARVKAGNRVESLGTFDTPEEAARAYDARAVELFGEFAWTNLGREVNFEEEHPVPF